MAQRLSLPPAVDRVVLFTYTNDLCAATDYLLWVRRRPPPRSMLLLLLLLLFNASEKIRFWFVLEGPPSSWLCVSVMRVRVSKVMPKK